VVLRNKPTSLLTRISS